ncbi:hypothetical protein F2Q69_00058653 [Brassica cretica]|uniref:Uncharacterized protein n=1 Tax=Brassica cretica TaxID=69181 RepID=A0A8S9RJQ4_BRACR|nr:hypothetical protein F2Q69_00058653 [Brassica cretica]
MDTVGRISPLRTVDATQIISYVSTRSLRYEPAKKLIIAWLNGHFMGLIGLIHERNHEEKPTILNSSSSKRSPVFRLLINHEEEAACKTQEEKLQEWRYNKRTAEMIAEYERDQEKEAKESRPERDKWKKPFNKEATRSYFGSRSNGVKPSSPKKAVQKPQSKPVVETPSTRTEEKRNKGFEKWMENFKDRIHKSITNPRPF